MWKTALIAPVILYFLAGSGSCAEISVGVSIDDDGLRGFHLAISKHYKVEGSVVTSFRHRRIPDEHLPVVFFLAQKARVSPGVIAKLRLGGKSWMDISLHFGLNTEIFYVPIRRHYGPPYGKAFGHFKNCPRSEWASLRIPDNDIVTLVNVKFLSVHYGFTPDEVVGMWGKHGNFIKAQGHLKLKKASIKKAGGVGKSTGRVKVPVSSQTRAGKGKQKETSRPPAHRSKRSHGGGRGKGRGM